VLSQVETVYKCIICGKAWNNIQSLRAHMKVHRKEGYVRTGVVVKKELWAWFKAYCKEHNTTTCHLFNALLEMAKKGTEEGVMTLGAPNPVVINMSQVFLGKPRSRYKVDVSELTVDKNVCHVCGGRVVRERKVPGTELIEGECLTCGARWLIHPSTPR